jgi:hypothetical protein
MDQHTALSAQFAEHFGNELFEADEPREQMLHIIANHDAGWKDLDKSALRDPATGLPYNLVQTPFEHIVATSKASADFNGATHPYCELLSSMHSWGLYNGRYGMSDKVLLNSLADDNRAAADRMLNAEIERQERLKTQLRANPATAAWVEESRLFPSRRRRWLLRSSRVRARLRAMDRSHASKAPASFSRGSALNARTYVSWITSSTSSASSVANPAVSRVTSGRVRWYSSA